MDLPIPLLRGEYLELYRNGLTDGEQIRTAPVGPHRLSADPGFGRDDIKLPRPALSRHAQVALSLFSRDFSADKSTSDLRVPT